MNFVVSPYPIGLSIRLKWTPVFIWTCTNFCCNFVRCLELNWLTIEPYIRNFWTRHKKCRVRPFGDQQSTSLLVVLHWHYFLTFCYPSPVQIKFTIFGSKSVERNVKTPELMDGPWWHLYTDCNYNEACNSFQFSVYRGVTDISYDHWCGELKPCPNSNNSIAIFKWSTSTNFIAANFETPD